VGHPIVTNEFCGVACCAKVRELSEQRLGVVRGVSRGNGVLDMGPRRALRWGGFVPDSLLAFPLGH